MEGFQPCNGCTEPTLFEGLKLASVTGCYAEFGMFRGNSFAAALTFCNNDERKLITKCFGFDSFEGFPAPQDDIEKIYTKGTMGDTSYDEVITKIARLGCSQPYQIIKGFFDDSFVTIDLPTISVCLVDCDSYSSSKSVLNYITPRMQKGSIIIFDDYYLADGCQKRAVDELIASGHTLEFIKEVVSPDWHVPIYRWN